MTRRGSIGVVLAGGGTGGHIHPNLAVAEAIAERVPGDASFVFVVSSRAIDQRVLAEATIAGEPARSVVSPARPMLIKPVGLARFALNWGGGVRVAREAIRSLQTECDRVVMLATGGFVSAPAVMGARAEGIERVVANLDAVPGKANRLASRFATRTVSVGRDLPPIVGARWHAPPSPAEARQGFGLDADAPTLLVTGGSQGARSVNRFVIEALRATDDLAGWQVIHQTGEGEEQECAAAWTAMGVRAFVGPYIDRMERAFAAADAAVCRGGAGTIADLWASKTPALILPYPHHRDRHQTLNAEPLTKVGGAIVAHDHVDPAQNASAHGGELRRLLDDRERASMRQALGGLGPADGAARLAEILLSEALLSETPLAGDR